MDATYGPPVIYVRDPRTMRFTYVDDASVEQSGFTFAELQGMTPKAFMDRTTEQIKAVGQVLITGAAESVEFITMIRRKDESHWRPVHVRAELLVVPDHRPQIMMRISEVDLSKMSTCGLVCQSEQGELESTAHVT